MLSAPNVDEQADVGVRVEEQAPALGADGDEDEEKRERRDKQPVVGVFQRRSRLRASLTPTKAIYRRDQADDDADEPAETTHEASNGCCLPRGRPSHQRSTPPTAGDVTWRHCKYTHRRGRRKLRRIVLWWLQGRFNQYWFARRFYASLIKRYRKSGKLLEIGCGLGDVLARLEDDFETLRHRCLRVRHRRRRRRIHRSRTCASRGRADRRAAGGPFDVIAAFHVVEHLEDPFAVLQLCARMTSPGGLLVFATPNTDAPFARKKGDRWFAND